MKISIIITTQKAEENDTHRSKVWEGELDILDENEYLVMLSILGEGQMQPICQIPFSTGIGHYVWIAPEPIREMGDYIEDVDPLCGIDA